MIPTRRLVARAHGYLELGMVAEAAGELGRIAGAEQDGLDVLVLRLAVLQEQEDWRALRTLAGEFAARAPDQASAWVTWAYATRRAVSLEEAERILLEAEKHHPMEATIQFNLGCYACQRGDLLSARRRVNRAIVLDKKFSTAAATDPDLAPLRAATRRSRRTV